MSWISILLYHGLGFCLEEAGRVEDSTFMENTLLTSAMFPQTLMKKTPELSEISDNQISQIVQLWFIEWLLELLFSGW